MTRRVAVLAAATCIAAVAYAWTAATLVDALITSCARRHPTRPR